MSEELHLGDSEERKHYTVSKSKPLKFNTRVLYAGKLSRTKQWAEKYHCHAFLEVVFIVSGSGHIKLNDTLYDVKKGDIVVYPPNTMHREYTNGDEPLEIAFFAVTGLKISKLPEDYLFPESHSPVVSVGEDFGRIEWLFNAVLKETENNTLPYSEMMTDFYVKLLLTEILRKTEINESTLVKNAAFNDIYNYIRNNYVSINTIDDICENLYVNKYYVSHVFKKYSGYSPMQYVTKCRMTLAKELLENTNLNVNEIAAKCGYDDAINFFRNFKKVEGTTPLAYRTTVTNAADGKAPDGNANDIAGAFNDSASDIDDINVNAATDPLEKAE